RILSGVVKSGSRVKIEGHCDATGTDEYNYALGLRRAKSAKEALVDRGINSSSITMISMGESSPACTTDYSSACYAKNRRVEFKVIN
ncbi:MAG TPA: peptidoglycan-associated lipoprotein, partial [Campylobacterales bacterium]|nr:peptidoglycan-associated lipoprotein [Campylobacterales bacterium]